MTGLSASMHVAAEVWNALGVELTIFALTFTIGHMVQFVANCKFAQGAKQKKGMEWRVCRSAFYRVGRRLCFGGAWLAGWLLPGRSREGCGGSAKKKNQTAPKRDAVKTRSEKMPRTHHWFFQKTLRSSRGSPGPGLEDQVQRAACVSQGLRDV